MNLGLKTILFIAQAPLRSQMLKTKCEVKWQAFQLNSKQTMESSYKARSSATEASPPQTPFNLKTTMTAKPTERQN